MYQKKEVWISDITNKKVKQIKQSFSQALHEQSKDAKINYYDFLLVAKKLSFRFEESTHLMSLKNFFSKNKNLISIKKLVDCLCVSQECLNSKDDKIIVKFNVPDHDFAPIKEVTNEDEEQYYDSETEGLSQKFEKVGSDLQPNHNEQQVNQKMTIILSIKVEEMAKKIKLLINQYHYPNIFSVFRNEATENINYEAFKLGILSIIKDIREKIKMSEDDIKTLFHVLDPKEKGFLRYEDIEQMKQWEQMQEKLKEFYYSRINKDMVKNTLFKLGKVKNSSIQIYQLKNASVLQFQQIEESIVNDQNKGLNIIKNLNKKRVPHFGPLKGAAKWRKSEKHNSSDIKFNYNHPSSTSAKREQYLDKEREKIERILRNSKEEKKREKKGETVASKLRSLFIHKVILPRQKMLEEEKEKYLKGRNTDNQLSIRPLKETY